MTDQDQGYKVFKRHDGWHWEAKFFDENGAVLFMAGHGPFPTEQEAVNDACDDLAD